MGIERHINNGEEIGSNKSLNNNEGDSEIIYKDGKEIGSNQSLSNIQQYEESLGEIMMKLLILPEDSAEAKNLREKGAELEEIIKKETEDLQEAA